MVDYTLNLVADEPQIVHKDWDSGTKELLTQLCSSTLASRKQEIVGLRCEDLFFMLDCIKKGYVPVTKGPVMAKYEEALYFAPNPDSSFFRSAGLNIDEGSFYRCARRTIRLYSRVAQVNPLVKIFEGLGIPQDKLVDGWSEDGKITDSECFYRDLTQELKRTPPFNLKHRFPAHYRLGTFIPDAHKNEASRLMKTLVGRRGILLGLGYRLITAHGMPKESEEGFDLALNIPDGRISLDCILGFEPLGDFEERVIASITNS